MKPADPFPGLLRAFFYEWMVEQRNASAHTIRSYRDTWRLFLRFVAQLRQRTVAQLALAELTASEVSAFLQYTEQERHDSIGTRNCRLAALRSFFGFVAGREPAAAAQCAEVLRIPTKKAPVHAPSYPDLPEVEAILAQPDRSTTFCCPSCTTPARAFKKRSMYVPRRSVWTLPLVCACTARAARNASVHCGRKPCHCSRHSSSGSRERTTNESSSIAMESRSVRQACASSWLSTWRLLPRACRAWHRSTSRLTASVMRLRYIWSLQALTSP
jgi:hypothetical protein